MTLIDTKTKRQQKKCTNIINTIMTNTIKFLNNKSVMLTKNGKTFILTEIKNPNTVNKWYTINGKHYA